MALGPDTPRRLPGTALAAGLALAASSLGACAIEEVLPVPSCTEGATVILVAQSVPSAQVVPCFDPLPDGWVTDTVRIDQDGTVIRLDSDRAGDSAAVFHYADACEVGDAVEAPSEYDDTARFELVERVDRQFRARRYYRFEGGCMWWDFRFDGDAPAALSIELGDRVQTVSRADLAQSIRETFVDEEL